MESLNTFYILWPIYSDQYRDREIVWKRFLNYCWDNGISNDAELKKYRAKLLFGHGVVEFADLEGKTEFLLTWS